MPTGTIYYAHWDHVQCLLGPCSVPTGTMYSAYLTMYNVQCVLGPCTMPTGTMYNAYWDHGTMYSAYWDHILCPLGPCTIPTVPTGTVYNAYWDHVQCLLGQCAVSTSVMDAFHIQSYVVNKRFYRCRLFLTD